MVCGNVMVMWYGMQCGMNGGSIPDGLGVWKYQKGWIGILETGLWVAFYIMLKSLEQRTPISMDSI